MIFIALSKYGRLSVVYMMIPGYGFNNDQFSFAVDANRGWYAIPNGKTLSVTYKGIYGDTSISIPYILAYGIG